MTYTTEGIALPDKVFSPSLEVDVSAGGSDTLEFRGRDALAYGVTRMIFYSSAPDDTLIDVSIEDQDKTLFRNQTVRVLNDMAEASALPSPIIIPKKRNLIVDISNAAGTATTVHVMLQGLTEPQLAVIQAMQRRRYGFIPECRFIYGDVSTDDGDIFEPMDVTIPPGNWVFNEVFLGVQADSAANRDDTIVRLRSGDYTVKQPARVPMYRTQFRYGGTEGSHYTVMDFDPFDVEVSNETGNNGVTSHALIPVVPADVLRSHNDVLRSLERSV